MLENFCDCFVFYHDKFWVEIVFQYPTNRDMKTPIALNIYIVSNFYLVIQYEFGTPNQYFQVRIKLFPEAWSYVSKLEKGSSMVDC